MSNILDSAARQAMLERMRSLSEGAKARWGKMSVNQMVCHVADPLRIAMGRMKVEDVSSFVSRQVLRRMVLAGLPPPKGKIRTFDEIDQARGGGTQPTDLAADVDTFGELLERYAEHVAAGKLVAPNPAFGPLTAKEWGRLVWVHTNHHLKQFGA